MNSRERVLAALDHREPDRVPVDFGGHRSSGIAAMAYGKLKAALGITSGDVYVYDMLQQLAIVEPDVQDALGVDTVELGRAFLHDAADWQAWVLPDGTACRVPAYLNLEQRGEDWYLLASDGTELAIQKKGCLYFEQIHWPWEGRDMDGQDFSDLEAAFGYTMWTAVPSPGGHIPLDDAGLEQLVAGAKALRASTDRAIIGLFGGNLFELPQWLYRIDHYLLQMAMYPEACRRLSEALLALYLPRLDAFLRALGPHIDVILFGDDLGGQNGPFMSTEMYREYYKPFHAAMWGRVKELAPNLRTNLHCCGGVEPLFEDLIDAGLDSINPVQITCRDMEAPAIKAKYGDRIAFWGGGCDTRDVLPNATPEAVYEHVRRQLEIMAPGGGFIFQQVHNILADVPPENVLAMFRALR